MKRFRRYVYNVLEVSEDKKGASWYFDIALTALIALNTIAIILQSVKSLDRQYNDIFETFELFSTLFFSIEYALRIWATVENDSYKDPLTGRLRFALTPLAIIDLLAILPFYLTLLTVDLRFMRIIRLFRLFRLFKVVRYVSAINVIGSAFKKKKEQLIVSIVFILCLLLIISCVMYYTENDAQPDNFSSIPQTMWWGVSTLTTVGYGDVYPITPLGKFLGGVIAILGIGLFALPTGILASGLTESFEEKKDDTDDPCCPNCGHDSNKNKNTGTQKS